MKFPLFCNCLIIFYVSFWFNVKTKCFIDKLIWVIIKLNANTKTKILFFCFFILLSLIRRIIYRVDKFMSIFHLHFSHKAGRSLFLHAKRYTIWKAAKSTDQFTIQTKYTPNTWNQKLPITHSIRNKRHSWRYNKFSTP